eukprot:9065722-Pyramimonas_sp.AAC.2
MPTYDSVERDLDSAEICSGWGEFSRQGRLLGGACQEFDSQTRHPDEDLTSFRRLIFFPLAALQNLNNKISGDSILDDCFEEGEDGRAEQRWE